MATPPSPASTSRSRNHNNNSNNNNSNNNNRKRGSTINEDETDPSPSSAASTRPSHRIPLLVHPLPIHLLPAGWNRLESVPRLMMERTLGVVLPTVVHQHQHQQRHASAMVQQVLWEQQDHDYNNNNMMMMFEDMETLKIKYAKAIRNNGEIQSVQKQIRGLRQQLQQQRNLRERLEKKHAMSRDKEQKQLQHVTLKLHHALEQMSNNNNNNSSSKNRGCYHKALSTTRVGTKSKRTSTASSSNTNTTSTTTSTTATTTAASMVHSIATSPMTLMAAASAALPTPSALTLMTTTTVQPLSPEEQEAWTLETDILKTMHYTMVYQNQCDLLEASSKHIISSLKRERAVLDTQQAETTMIQMVLDGTQRAMQDLYQEIVLRQEILLERILQPSSERPLFLDRQDSSSNNSSSIPRLIAPTQLHSVLLQRRRPPPQRQQATASSSNPFVLGSHRDFVGFPSDGISDLGDSINRGGGLSADSMTDISSSNNSIGDASFHNLHDPNSSSQGLYYAAGPPVFTSVQALQQQTLQNMAGVESF